jgi:outer membrane receptor protein involved in Fe transport
MKKLNVLLLASTCMAGFVAMPAMAQDQTDQTAVAETGKSDDIVVTGSRITRPNATAAAPIQSVTASAIQAQAAVNVEEVLNRLPQIAPDSQQNYQDSDGRQRIKLRNLGFERTLTLVDGKRLGTQNGLDANMIPPSLIERVDVLTGGASAVYGSDAIAGVVNFIMKKDFQGIQLNANYNFYAHENKPGLVSQVAGPYSFPVADGNATDGARVDLSLTAGTKLFDDALSISGFVNYRQADLVPYGARETSGCQLVEAVKDGPLSCSTSTYSPSGYVSPQSGANAGAAYVNNPNGTRTFVPFGLGAGLAANPYDGYSFQRKNERWNAGGFASLHLSDAVELYANGMWFRDRSSNPYPARVYSYTAYGSTPYQVNCNNPFLSASQATAICGASAGTSALAPLDVRYRFNSLPYVDDVYINQGLRIAGGVRGNFAEAWSYDVGAVYARNKQAFTWGNFPDYDKVNNALNVVNVNGTPTCVAATNGTDSNCVPFDAFSANNNNTALFNYLLTGRNGTSTTVNTLYNAIATVQGDLGKYGIKSPWADQGLAVAFNLEYREDKLHSYADATYRAENGGSDADLAQHVWEASAEVQAPLIEDKRFAHLLQFNGAYRMSKYSSNPDKFSTWKLEALYAPIPDITFRGSINRAQRAPTVVEAYQASNSNYGVMGGTQNDFCAPTVTRTPDPSDPSKTITTYGAPIASQQVCRATGLADNLYGSTTLLCPDDKCTVRYGGFTVDPETAYTKTVGIVLKPRFLPGLVVSADRFLIDLKDSIGYNDYDYFWNGCLQTSSDFFCSKFIRAANGTLYSAPATNPSSGYIRGGTTNYYRSKSHGWDFQAQYNLGLGGAGSLGMDFSGSLTTYAGGQDSPILAKYNCAGYYGGGCGQLIPKWSHNLRTTYTTADNFFSASLNWRHLGSLTNVTNSGDPSLGWTQAGERATFYRIPAFDYFDLALNFRIAKKYSFRISANNIFDKTPPILPNSYNYGLSRNNTLSARYDSLGRQIAFGTTVNF